MSPEKVVILISENQSKYQIMEQNHFSGILPTNLRKNWLEQSTKVGANITKVTNSQPAFTSCKLTIETLKQGVKYVQS